MDGNDYFFAAILSFTGLLLLFTVVMVIASAIADRTCLEKGFPKYIVTYNLDTYCLNLDGSVTVKVERQ